MNLHQATIAACLRVGVTEFCLCAGSRNSPLVRQVAAQPDVKIWHFFEERDAAFFALGRCRARMEPVAVLTTSGTAAAELFPAVIEAHYQGLPLLCITADRPVSYRYSGAPQAINQEQLFGEYAQPFQDVSRVADCEALFCRPEMPAHWNICLEEPQPGVTYDPLPPPSRLKLVSDDWFSHRPVITKPDLILIGELQPGERRRACAIAVEHYTTPIWAEAASGIRGWLKDYSSDVNLLPGGDAILKGFSGQYILRLGGVPSCRLWRDLEQRPEVTVTNITRSKHPGLARKSSTYAWKEFSDIEWVPNNTFPPWRPAPASQPEARDIALTLPLSEACFITLLARCIPEDAGIFLGNSLTIRNWNLLVRPHQAEAQSFVLRGANGIDGNLSFALGALADYREAWIVVGDLTAMYNLAAPWILSQMKNRRIRFVVMNNGGGKLFRRLPSLKDTNAKERTLIENPHQVQLSGWAQMWNLAYREIATQEDWDALRNEQFPDQPMLLELKPDAEQSEEFWTRWAVAGTSS